MGSHKRIVIYMPEDEYRALRSKLVLQGKTFSQWVREKVRRFLTEDDE